MADKRRTATVSKSMLSGHGAKCVNRAREALPILVRLAHAERTITYGNLAVVMNMPNARNLNYVLGSIGATLDEISLEVHDRIPPLQSIVVNSGTGVPGKGFDKFLRDWYDARKITRENRSPLLRALQRQVFSFPRWNRILQRAGIQYPDDTSVLLAGKLSITEEPRGHGGESEAHKAFKDRLAAHPEFFGLRPTAPEILVECGLASGDFVDVLFKMSGRQLAVEAKSRRSSESDMIRGVFQCIKYQAVLQAELIWSSTNATVTSLLALEGQATETVRQIAALLDVTIMENV